MPPAQSQPLPDVVAGRRADLIRPREWCFVALLAASLLGTVWIKAQRTYLTHDEIITALLVRHASLGQLIEGIRDGTETNPPLYFFLEWVAARCFGTGDLAMCALSGLSVALAVPFLFLTLRRLAGPGMAALTVAAVFGLSRDVYLFATWARYYGWMVLLASLVAWLFTRFHTEAGGAPPRRRDYAFVFLAHAALVYTHLFGLFFSGATLAAHVALDWLGGKWRWRLYGSIAGAWATFLVWAPNLPRQLSVTRDGTFTPRLNVGNFFDELGMQTPLAVILSLAGALLLLEWLSRRPDSEPDVPMSGARATAMLTLAGAWLLVAVGAWAGSLVIKPFFMRRYVAPCVVAWVLLLGVVLAATWRATWLAPRLARPLPRWLRDVAWAGVLGLCLVWQPLRAWKEPAKAATPVVDHDHGLTQLPIVFEDPMDFIPRALYGGGRDYALLIDESAAAASSGYYTKLGFNYHSRWIPHLPDIRIVTYDRLPAWPEGFLAVDDAMTQTFDWLFKNKPELKVEPVGPWAEGKTLVRVRRATPP